MHVLAEISLEHLLLLVFGTDDEIDPDYQSASVGAIPALLQRLSPAERNALSDIAARRIASAAESGITDGPEVEFLEIVADQSIYEAGNT